MQGLVGPRAILNVAEKSKSQSWHVFESQYSLVAQPPDSSRFLVTDGFVFPKAQYLKLLIVKWYTVYLNLSLNKRKFKRKIILLLNIVTWTQGVEDGENYILRSFIICTLLQV
jgi:hypothetical protein